MPEDKNKKGYTIFHSNGSTKEVAPEHTPIIDKLAADNSDESINNFYNPNHIPSNTVRVWGKSSFPTQYDEKIRNSRVGERKNEDGTFSTHKMSYTSADGKYYAYPTLFQKEDKSFYELSDKDNWAAWNEAKKKGEIYEFNTEEEAKKFSAGSWKEGLKDYDVRSKEYKDLYDSGHLASYDAKTNTYYATPLKEVVITAEAPQWLKDKRKAEQIYKQNEINYQSRNPVENTNINKEITSSYLKDRQTKQPEEIHWYNAINYKKWGLKDYSSYSSFNSAFRNSKESGEKEFVYKEKRYNTDLISKEQSDLYYESKKFLEDYYKNQDYKPFKTELPYNIKDMYIKEKFGKTWLEYYNEIVDSDDYKPGSKNFDKIAEQLNMLDTYNENKFKNNKDYELFIEDYINKERKKQRDIELNNLKTPYYFSITDKKPKDMVEDGYLDGRNKKIFLNANSQKGKLNTTYIHELSHKADDYEVYKRVPNINVDLLNNDNNFKRKYNNEMFTYISDPSEIEARKFSTLFYLYKNKRPYSNINKQDLDNLYKEKDENLPYDIRQLLDLYSNQKEDLLKYLNNDFSYKNKNEQ